MPLKDHYRILGISANATLKEVKKAYYQLAHKYHPDKNPDNLAEKHFREIIEAYQVLSNDTRRKQYDEERYFAGLFARKEPEKITGTWILSQAIRLRLHMDNIDSYRMNHLSLHDYVHLLLSDSHLAVINNEQDNGIRKEMIRELLLSLKGLKLSYYESLKPRLLMLADTDEQLCSLVNQTFRKRKKETTWEQYLPLLIITITILLCVIMFWYSRNK